MASKQYPSSNLEVSPFDQKCISIHGLMVDIGSLAKAEAASSSIGLMTTNFLPPKYLPCCIMCRDYQVRK